MESDGSIHDRFPDWNSDAARARWPEIVMKLALGQKVRGEVIARMHFGVWVDIGVGHPALLLITEMSGLKSSPIRYEEFPALGETIEAWVMWMGERRLEILLNQRPKWVPVPGQ